MNRYQKSLVKTTKKGNARKDKPVGSRLAFDATKQEADKKKKMKPPPIPPNIKGKKIKQTTGQKNLQALLGLGDLASMIADEKKKINQKRKDKLEEVFHHDLEEASSRANKEQNGTGLKHHPDTSKNTLINYIFKKGLNVEKHLKDIKREGDEKEEKRKKEYEAGIAKMEKQAKRGTLPWKQFYEVLQDDDKFTDEYDERFNNIRENYTWGSDFYRIVKKITKRDVDVWSDLTDEQQDKYYDLVSREVDREHKSYLKKLYEEVIKKKKFNSLKEAVDIFVKKYESD